MTSGRHISLVRTTTYKGVWSQTDARIATIPTVGDALGALDDLCTDLTTTLKQIADIGAELAHKGQSGTDSANEVRSRKIS